MQPKLHLPALHITLVVLAVPQTCPQAPQFCVSTLVLVHPLVLEVPVALDVFIAAAALEAPVEDEIAPPPVPRRRSPEPKTSSHPARASGSMTKRARRCIAMGCFGKNSTTRASALMAR